MTRLLLAAVTAALVGGAARADFGQTLPPAPAPQQPSADGPYGPNAEEVYGLHPAIRKLFFWKKDVGACKNCKKQAPLPPGYGTPGGPGGPQVGTLVFPNHPYARSPRDYFMYEPGR